MHSHELSDCLAMTCFILNHLCCCYKVLQCYLNLLNVLLRTNLKNFFQVLVAEDLCSPSIILQLLSIPVGSSLDCEFILSHSLPPILPDYQKIGQQVFPIQYILFVVVFYTLFASHNVITAGLLKHLQCQSWRDYGLWLQSVMNLHHITHQTPNVFDDRLTHDV